jgi:DNA-binding beta-propeller fold protein YncE
VVLPHGAALVARIDVSAGPGEFAVGEGAVWAGNFDDGTLTRIDPASNRVVGHVDIPSGPGEAAAGAGAVWVTNTRAGTVARFDPRTAKRVATVRVGPQPGGVAVGSDAVWVANGGGPTVSRIDPATNRVVATIRIGPRSACCSEHIAITARDGAVWAAVPNMDAVVHIDPADNSIAATVKLSGSPCAGIAVDAASVWSAGGACGDFLTRVDPRTGRVGPARVELAHPIGVELFAGAVWVAALGSKTVDRLDPVTGRIVGRLPVGGLPIRTGVGFGSLWVRDDSGRVLRIRPVG